MKIKLIRPKNKGFTIVELMIATTILSTILVLVTGVMISIGRLYYKGINQARVQDAVRTIVDDVSQHLQLNDKDPTNGGTQLLGGETVQTYCIGTARYTYVTGVKIGDVPRQADNTAKSGQIFRHILWRDTVKGGCSGPADLAVDNPSSATGGSDGTELIPGNSQLTSFSIDLSGSPYAASISIAFGDNDLLNLNGADTTCRGASGDQFCSTASLSTTAVKRLVGQP
jgi:prepilin-type N-terminal cleavage/methylation domain-containing protein